MNSAYPPTIIIRHPKENPRKCSILPLRGRPDLIFLTYPVKEPPPLEGYVRLAAEGPELSAADADRGILLLDGSWRWAESMNRAFLAVPPRSLRGWRTAYPRASKRGTDPDNGLASVEALFVAYHLLGRPTDGLLDHYRWAEEFLRINALFHRSSQEAPAVNYRRVSTLKTAADFQGHLSALGIDLPFDAVVETGLGAPLAQPFRRSAGAIGNRFAVLPMEGWDGTADGRPTDLTRRRWRNFGLSGAKLVWGGEAVAVRHDGRANPNQFLINDATVGEIAELREILLAAHREQFGRTDDLLIGLQLTHSGRFARPNEKGRLEPRVAYRHPYLDARFGVHDDAAVLSDDEIARLADDFVKAARLAHSAGFAFVDVKHCHGYLGHEFLSAFSRPGRYGGNLENRTRFLRDIVSGIRAAVSGLEIGVRVSVFDFVPFQGGADGTGEPMVGTNYPYAFGGDGSGLGINLDEPSALFDLLEKLGIDLICTTAGSPYYNPHVQRPALFPPSDGYQPPEDPLIGVARQLAATARLKERHPRLTVVGSAYSYLQEWLPNVGQRVLRDGGADFIGLGRVMLSYPELPADVLAGRPLTRKRLCRTFSDCTTAPRNGLVSGCYPLDPFYKERPERERLMEIKGP